MSDYPEIDAAVVAAEEAEAKFNAAKAETNEAVADLEVARENQRVLKADYDTKRAAYWRLRQAAVDAAGASVPNIGG